MTEGVRRSARAQSVPWFSGRSLRLGEIRLCTHTGRGTGLGRKIPQGSSEPQGTRRSRTRLVGTVPLHGGDAARHGVLHLPVKTARQKLFRVKSSVFLELFKSTSFCRARRRSGLETFQQGWRKILTSTTRALALSSLLLHPCGPCSRRFEGRALLLQRSACSPHAVLVPAQEHLAE